MIRKFLDLGLQPLANKYLTKKDLVKKKVEYYYHLEIGFNTTSKLVSILNTVPSKQMFDKKYPYRASMSKTMLNSFKKLSRDITKNFNPDLIMEIGSNDGSFVKNFGASSKDLLDEFHNTFLKLSLEDKMKIIP